MNNKGTCHLNDNKMDVNTVWQWRILHVKKYSRHPEPFHYSNEIGLDFNIACNTQKKLDLQLVTNGVILEVCDFAKTVSKNKRHFITNILENNFSLGLENEQQRSDFTAQILHKVNNLIRNPPKDVSEVFTLSDMSPKPGSANNSNHVQKTLSTECKTKSFLLEIDDSDDSEHENKLNCSEAISKDYIETESLLDEMDRAHAGDSEQCLGGQSRKELEDAFPPSFPQCEEIGLNLDVGSKQSLDPSLLTKGVMLEVVDFTRVLAASCSRIILDLLEHNFELDLKNQLVKNRIWLNISHLLKRRKQLTAVGSTISPEFNNEPFSLQTFARQHDKRGFCTSEEQIQTPQISPNKGDMKQKEMGAESIHPCPPEESDLDPGDSTDSRNIGNEDHLENPESCSVSSDTPKSESSCLGMHDTFLTSTHVSSSLPTVNSDVNSRFTSQNDEKGLIGGEEQTPSPQGVPNKWDTEQEKVGTENNMWKLRSNRVEQIVSSQNNEFCLFTYSKKLGLEFNVGVGPKQNMSAHCLTNAILLEIAKFAIAINSSQKEFIMEILEYNFDLGLQSQHQRNTFTHEMVNSLRPSRNRANQSVGDAIPELSSISGMEKCDVGPSIRADSHAESREHVPHKCADLYPLCKEIGLKLHVNNSQPNRKLEINKLTNGVMTEVTKFAEKLCGTFEEICLDVLRHNFDLDLQSGDSDPAKNILARIPILVEQKNLSRYHKSGKNRKINGSSSMYSKNNPNQVACDAGSSQAAITNQKVGSSTDGEDKKDVNSKLWKLRTKQIQHILSVPHEENCPLYSYSRCKKLGIDFNVGSGMKQNLDPKFLTNGIMAELNAFAVALLSSIKYFITEILEFNFNLDLKDELDRSAFAQKIMKRLDAIRALKKGSEARWKIPFELPDMRCIQEPSFDRTTYCPRCYQERNHKIGQDRSDAGHVSPCLQSMTDTVSAHENYSTEKHVKDTSFALSTTEEMIMNSNPCCKKIGLTLCVDKDRPTDKLDTKIVTRGVMMEVENFAKILCGTKLKILHDLLEHNFNISMQQTPTINFVRMQHIVMAEEDHGLAYFDEVFVFRPPSQRQPGHVTKIRSVWRETIQKENIALQTKEERATLPNPNNSVVKSNKNHSDDNEHKNELNLKLWRVRANRIQQILSIPHEDNCPLYSYSRCKKLGIDFNVGSGVKHNLEPKLLTNGIMAELNTFASALLSSREYFVTEILEYNFNLDLKNEQYRSAFGQKTMEKILALSTPIKSYRGAHLKLPFELPDMRSIQETTYEKSAYCPKCYQDQSHKLRRNESYTDQLHNPCPDTMSDAVSANINYTAKMHAKDPSSTFSATEEMIMNSNRHCKKTGVALCVDADQPKDKLDTHVLTWGIIKEVADFAKKLCGTIHEVINDVLEHNFNISMQSPDINPSQMFKNMMRTHDGGLTWLDEVFVIRPENYYTCPIGESDAESDKGTDPENTGNEDHFENPESCSVSSDIPKTESSCLGMHDAFLTFTDVSSSLPTVNSDVNSPFTRQHDEIGLIGDEEQTPSPQSVLKSCTVPALMELKDLLVYAKAYKNKKWRQRGMSTVKKLDYQKIPSFDVCSAGPSQTEMKYINISTSPDIEHRNDTEYVSKLCTGEKQTQTSRNVPCECDVKTEEIKTEKHYTCPIVQDSADSGNTCNEGHLENPESCTVSSDTPKSESSCLGMHDTFLNSTHVPSSLQTVNSDVNLPFTRQNDEIGLIGGEEQTPSPQSVLNKWDTEQEEVGTETNMWKLRSNRVEQIISSQNKEFVQFRLSKRAGLKFNVGFCPKQNISFNSLTTGVKLEIAKFAIAINSSQKEFIMEILEYNFDLGLQSQHQRNTFTHEMMNKVRQLRCCEDAVKLSNEVRELPGPRPSRNRANQSVDNAIPELSSISGMEKWDVGPSIPADSHAESKEHVPHKCADLYPLCKEIGLKLHVNNSQPNRKLEINKLTNGVMTEVTKFAEKLCGTFEEIYLDVLRHNCDLDLQSEDSDLAKNILAQIPILVEQNNLSLCHKSGNNRKIKGSSGMFFKNNPNQVACDAGSSQAAITNQKVGSSTDGEDKKDVHLKLWKLRTKQIQHILSMPHEENCPLYSYSRCKKLGIDFNVGSGIKQNLDPKFLTNGIMAELNAFAVALLSSTKYFITEILEFNFNLDFIDELYHSAFAQKIMTRLDAIPACKKSSEARWKIPFELPDMRCTQEPSFDRTTYCPRCYQERNHKIGQDRSYAGHVSPSLQSMTDTVSAHENYSTEKDTSSALSTIEEMIMNSNPCCKKKGLSLCVDKDRPTDKLDTKIVTRGVMMEVENFAKKLCGTKLKILHDLLEHNFNITLQQTPFIDFGCMYRKMKAEEDDGLAYFDEVFVFRPPSQRQPGHVTKMRAAALATQRSDWRETIQKRKIALQTKVERATLPNPNNNVVTSMENLSTMGRLFPFCTKIGLVLDVTSQSEKKEKLDLNLLTAAVVDEIHKFVTKNRVGCSLFDILDYNFDLSSEHHRRTEFSVATASKVLSLLKRYRKKPHLAHEVLKLPFVKKKGNMKRKRSSQDEPGKKRKNGRSLHQASCSLGVNPVSFLCGHEPNWEPWSQDEDTDYLTDPWMIHAQGNQSLASVGCSSPLPINIPIKEEEYDPYYAGMEAEPIAEERYHPHYYNVKTNSDNGVVGYLVPGVSAGSPGCTYLSMYPNTENVKTESKNEFVQYYILSEPQGCQGHAMLAESPNAENDITTELDSLHAQHWIPDEVATSHGDSMMPVCQEYEIKEEQDNVPTDSYNYGVLWYSESEEGIKHE